MCLLFVDFYYAFYCKCCRQLLSKMHGQNTEKDPRQHSRPSQSLGIIAGISALENGHAGFGTPK
jgi:hypothetical protein